MPDNLVGPDVDAGMIARVAELLEPLAPEWTVTDEFPLDGAFGIDRLAVVTTTFQADIDPRFTSQASVAVDVWAPSRAESNYASRVIRAGLTKVGGFRLDENGVVTRGVATLHPVREPSDDPSAVYVRHTATYDLSVRASAAG